MKFMAKWISAPRDTGRSAITFIRKIKLNGGISSAVLKVSSIGVYEATVNGEKACSAEISFAIK